MWGHSSTLKSRTSQLILTIWPHLGPPPWHIFLDEAFPIELIKHNCWALGRSKYLKYIISFKASKCLLVHNLFVECGFTRLTDKTYEVTMSGSNKKTTVHVYIRAGKIWPQSTKVVLPYNKMVSSLFLSEACPDSIKSQERACTWMTDEELVNSSLLPAWSDDPYQRKQYYMKLCTKTDFPLWTCVYC